MLVGKGKEWWNMFRCMSKDKEPGLSSISPEIRSRALSKTVIFAIDRYWGLKK